MTGMPMNIEPLRPEDAAEKAQVELEAFRTHPRMPMMWPRGYTPDYFAYKQRSDIASLEDPHYKIWKAVDTTTGKILGTAEWSLALNPALNAVPTQPGAAPPEGWPVDGNWQMRLWYTINLERLLKLYLEGKAYIKLNFLSVLPSAQGTGVGSMLLVWGTEVADRENVAVALESTPAGLPLYRKFGLSRSR